MMGHNKIDVTSKFIRAVSLVVIGCLALYGCGRGNPQGGNSPSSTSAANTPTVRVIVLGTIHSRHVTSEKYSLDILRDVIRSISPDYILTEIPPDRFDDAMTSFQTTGSVTEERVLRFPEYTDVVFPLLNEMDFTIIPTAAWTKPMAEFRTAALNRLARDESRKDDWASYTAALDVMNAKLKGREDDPEFIHSNSYDVIIKTGLAPYAKNFENDLGSGDWEGINKAHYELIEHAIGDIQGSHARDETLTILITYGAAHKYWFLEKLRARDDISVVNPIPYFNSATMP